MKNGKYPCSGIAICSALIPMTHHPLKGILNEIVGPHLVTQQRARIAAQGGQQWFDQLKNIAHDRISVPIEIAGLLVATPQFCQRT
ncbi:hypothetical protein AfiDRAFT_3737 [Afipia sp. 1NLS2]|nr:hypothetical protein AfiDRAFT_3737 [Afipia sp. 1NLS2]